MAITMAAEVANLTYLSPTVTPFDSNDTPCNTQMYVFWTLQDDEIPDTNSKIKICGLELKR